MTQANKAAELARRLLADPLPQRWDHTQGVARQARTLVPLGWLDVDALEAAAWLHDIGYAPDLAVTGFHPLDGARHLRTVGGFSPMVETLVARHSCSGVEAEQRGLAGDLDREFPLDDDQVIRDWVAAITYCDMTTSPTGSRVSVEERLREIALRYTSDDPVFISVHKSSPEIERQCADIARQLADASR